MCYALTLPACGISASLTNSYEFAQLSVCPLSTPFLKSHGGTHSIRLGFNCSLPNTSLSNFKIFCSSDSKSHWGSLVPISVLLMSLPGFRTILDDIKASMACMSVFCCVPPSFGDISFQFNRQLILLRAFPSIKVRCCRTRPVLCY